ncbi:DUF2177 family protein [Bradyrhizobium yuanmingense]|uniref:DUF2177 family protein n=1 Tax=Bradyrhizobium yuanmingense TaxID=108015 RepID=UPI0031BB578B
MNLLFTYLAVAVTFVAIDMIWLGIMVERLYRPVMGDMLRAEPNLPAAAVFYLLYPLGLIWFAVLPAQNDGSALRAFTSGVLLGCFTYATYDLTNQATLRNWSIGLTLADVCWGSLLAGVSSWIGFLMAQSWPTEHGPPAARKAELISGNRAQAGQVELRPPSRSNVSLVSAILSVKDMNAI